MRVKTFLALVLLVVASSATAQIEWRLSVKFILDDNGFRPFAFPGALNTDEEVHEHVNFANEVLSSLGRGYSIRLTEIVDLDGAAAFFDGCPEDTREVLDAAITAAPELFAFRSDAINYYVNNSDTSCAARAQCSFPLNGNTILSGQAVVASTMLHEIGHFFDLCHTQGCPCGSCDNSSIEPPFCETIPLPDDVDDTLPDLECWDQDDIALFSFAVNYGSLTGSQQDQVDDVFFNIMSYHGNRARLTPGQFDRATDTSNDERLSVASGKTWFVDITNNGVEHGTSSFPFQTVATGLTYAGMDDITLIRTGTYNENLTISQQVTMRGSGGLVSIGGSPVLTNHVSQPGD